MADAESESDKRASRGPRLDLLIAICALLISSFGSAASWWQARLLNEQTLVLRQQLSAQVWPYASFGENVEGDTVTIELTNDGLGPAILRSVVVSVDGKPESSLIDVMHALLGPHIAERKPRGEAMALHADTDAPGAALRPGESVSFLTFRSKSFARPFMIASQRISFRTCYCSIVPGQCWFADSASSGDPRPVPSCRTIPGDLMHEQPTAVLYQTL